jgi:thiamine biosynthesis protein ThiS
MKPVVLNGSLELRDKAKCQWLTANGFAMTLTINGEPRDFPDGLTLAALIAQLGMKSDRVAVELNLEIVPRGTWEATLLKSGDKLEIVHFVGGGSGSGSALKQHGDDEELSLQVWTCPSCSVLSDAKFCSNCGEKRPNHRDLAVTHLLSHAGETLFHWDSRLWRTFRVLFRRPGLLSCEYVAGKRKPYVHPFQVFFIANVLYFLLFPVIGWSGLKTPLNVYESMMDYSAWATRMATQRAAVKGMSMAQFGDRFDHVLELQAKSMVLVMVPMFAVALFAVEWRKGRYFGEHVTFSLHFIAVWLLLFMIAIPALVGRTGWWLRHLGVAVTVSGENHLIGWLGGALLAGYLFLALRRFYDDRPVPALLKAALLALISGQILELYRLILFVTTLYSV